MNNIEERLIELAGRLREERDAVLTTLRLVQKRRNGVATATDAEAHASGTRIIKQRRGLLKRLARGRRQPSTVSEATREHVVAAVKSYGSPVGLDTVRNQLKDSLRPKAVSVALRMGVEAGQLRRVSRGVYEGT